MPKFHFEAKAFNGKAMKGEIEASNEAEARVKLRAQRLVPMKIISKEAKKSQGASGFTLGGPKVKSKDLQIFTRQLATLLTSGIPILQAIETLSQGSRNPLLVKSLAGISADISRGRRLGDAFGEHPRVFNRFYVNMIRAGEESGNLDLILNRLAQYIEKAVKIQSQVKGAMTYPAVIMVIAVIVVSALLIFVIPKFQSLFGQQGADLPALTKMVIALSDAFISYWWAIFGAMGGGVYALIVYYNSPIGRQTCDMFLIDVPLIGNLIQKSSVAKFTRTMSTLLGSGVPIMDALDISAKTVGNFVMERAINRARDSITEGKSLTVPLAKEKYIPQMVVQMIGVGEQTGTLDQMLGRIADFYEDEVDVAVAALTTVIEPLMMAFLGVIIAFLVIAMYLPIFNLAGAVG